MARKTASDFPQGLIDLFQLYQHGEIDRAAFLAGAAKFAGGGVTAVGLWAMLKPDYALAIQVQPDDSRLHTERVTVASPNGNGSIKCYFVRPAGATSSAKVPAVLVCHENRGLNPYIEDVARRLGVAGYMALAPDGLTSVGGYPGDEEKATQLFNTVDKNKMTEDFVASGLWLNARPESTGRLGVVGFCIGGDMANKMATRIPAIRVAVPFYGMPPPPADVSNIRGVVLEHYAGLDDRVTSTMPTYDKELTQAGITHQFYVYQGANHGFHNDTTPRYDQAAATLAWDRTLTWFKQYLQS